MSSLGASIFIGLCKNQCTYASPVYVQCAIAYISIGKIDYLVSIVLCAFHDFLFWSNDTSMCRTLPGHYCTKLRHRVRRAFGEGQPRYYFPDSDHCTGGDVFIVRVCGKLIRC